MHQRRTRQSRLQSRRHCRAQPAARNREKLDLARSGTGLNLPVLHIGASLPGTHYRPPRPAPLVLGPCRLWIASRHGQLSRTRQHGSGRVHVGEDRWVFIYTGVNVGLLTKSPRFQHWIWVGRDLCIPHVNTGGAGLHFTRTHAGFAMGAPDRITVSPSVISFHVSYRTAAPRTGRPHCPALTKATVRLRAARCSPQKLLCRYQRA